MQAIGPLLTWALVTLIAAFIGSFLPGYLKRKGENLATREDIDMLIDQVRAVTQATKEIETSLSDRSWNRQRLWEMKRDAIAAAIQAMDAADDALMELGIAYQLLKSGGPVSQELFKQEKQVEWKGAIDTFDKKRAIVELVCTSGVHDALRAVSKAIRSNASKLFKKIISSYDEMGTEIQKARMDAYAAARTELGISEEREP
jgi:hypothetical protein